MSDAVVFVTGGSRGIGLALLEILLKGGNKVANYSRSTTPELQALSSKYGSALLLIKGDLVDGSAARAAIKKTKETFGRLDSVVLNAGAMYPLERIATVSVDEFKSTFEANVFSIIPFVQAALPYLKESKLPHGGKVVAVSSAAALHGMAGVSAYCSSKAALNILISALGNEEPSIVAVAVNPGMVETKMAKDMRVDGQKSMDPQWHGFMINSFESGKNNLPEVPGTVIAALALKAPKELTGKYFDFDSEEAKAVAA
ncbi:NAD(P)-binding protein [Auricularia subglabra TFB-10046 SS5]|nr:NAD(P)-binding protein [Auricularia subglabra TFB-10046 SS5]